MSSEFGQLQAVLLHRPADELAASQDPDAVQMLAPVDPLRAGEQHDALAAAYRAAGVQVELVAPHIDPPPNLLFVADLLWLTPDGAILCRPASTVRAGEERLVGRRLAELGVPILRSLRGGATFEGADAAWLAPDAALIGRGLRTNAEGAEQVGALLAEMGMRLIAVDLPAGVMHLMGILRIVDRDLALSWPGRLPAATAQALREHGYEVVAATDEREAAQGDALNLVVLGPRHVLMPAGNPVSQAVYEALGIRCEVVETGEIHKAAGNIGCMTGVLKREPA